MKPVRLQRVRVTSLRMGTATRPPAWAAASSLGVAGLILAFGADILWYPVGGCPESRGTSVAILG
jgi:Na+(H+)/acetate symporter ActP